MARDKQEIIGNPEFEALKDIPGINPEDIMRQVGLGGDPTPPGEGDPPIPAGGSSPTPPVPPAGQAPVPPAGKTDPTPTSQDDILKEIFGDRFKTVDEVKKANILGQLDELDGLRRTKSDLEKQLSVKPQTNFVNDEVALYNEFVRETGISDYGVFKRLHTTDVTNMDPVDALVTKYVLDNPNLAGKEPQVRKFILKNYNVDPDQAAEEEIEINSIGLSSEGSKAKKFLQELKEKLKVPASTPAAEAPKELTPEEEATLQTEWGKVGTNVLNVFSKLQIPIKGSKDPLLSYALSAEDIQEAQKFITSYAIKNRMELNEANVGAISRVVYSQLVLGKLPEIVHSVFERARKMTEKEVHDFYSNPSPERNRDMPLPQSAPAMTDAEKLEQDLFDAEMGMYNK